MFEQAFRNIDDVLRKEAGCTTELDYTEQTSWLLFLKYLDGLEQDKATEAAAGREEIHLHPRQALSLGKLGRAQGQGRQARPQHRADRRRPPRLRQPEALSLPARLQATGHRPEHHRIQDRRNLRRDQKQDSERLQPARDHRPHRRTALPLADREARALAPLRSQDQEHGQRRAQRRRVLHPAPAHPRHRPGRAAQDRRAHLRRRVSARRASCASRSTTSKHQAASSPPHRTATLQSAPSTARKRSPSPTSSRS